jgi:hypothetical protein
MRWLPAVLSLALLSALPSRAQGLRVQVDCHLPTGPVECPELTEGYFASATFLAKSLDDAEADLRLEVRVTGDNERATYYRLTAEGPRVTPAYVRVERMPVQVPPAAALLRLLAALQALTAPHLALEGPGATDAEGRLQLSLRAPEEPPPGDDVPTVVDSTDAPAGARARRSKTSGWYQSTSLFGTFNFGDNESITGTFSNEVNHSTPRWRFRTGASADYQRVVVRFGDVVETQEILAMSAKALLALSVVDGFSVALLANALNAPAENFNFEGRAGLGVAWDLIPFLTQQGNTLGAQYVLQAVHQNYVGANVLEQLERTHLQHGVDVVANWHFERMDVGTYASVSAVLGDNRFHRVGGGVTWSYRITAELALSLTGDANYRRAVLNSPKDSLIESELEQFLTGGKFSSVRVQGGVTLTYTLGNTVLRSTDQRWRQF